MMRWTFEPIFESYLLVGVLSVAMLLLLFVKPLFPAASPQKNRVLTWLRLAVIVLVTLAMLRPTWLWNESRKQQATIAFLLDQSRSMSMPDAVDRTRWQAATSTLREVAPELLELQESYEIQAYMFDSRATNVPRDNEFWELPEEPSGDETDIGTAMDDLLRSEAGKRLAAVFLLADGAQRIAKPRVDLLQPSRELARRGCPLYCISFGESRDQSQARDVAVVNLPDQYRVFVNNELEVRASVDVQGYSGKEIPVEMLVETPDGTLDRIGPVPLLVDEQSQQVQVTLSYSPTQVGQYKLTLKAEEQPGEQVIENNQLSAFLTVLDGGLRVLYLDGNLAWQERKFIRRVLDESPDIQVDLWLDTRQGQGPATDLPLDAVPPYDVYLIGDVAAESLGAGQALQIANAVADGKGLMMIGGVHSFGPGNYATSPLGPALPITMSRMESQIRGEPIRPDVHYSQELQMIPTTDHFITRLTAPLQNEARWRELPTLLGANRFRGLTDQAIVLAAAEDGQIPLLVEGKSGLGRVLAFAGDSTYRWYRYGFQQEHKRFWRQCMLWLAQKDQAQQNDVWIRLPQRRFRPGSNAPFTVGAQDASGTPIEDAKITVQLQGPGGFFQTMRIAREDDHWAGTSEPLEIAGDYEYYVTAERLGEKLGDVRGSFLVVDQDLELADPAANPQQLSALSQLTAEAGGRLIAADELSDILRQIANRAVDDDVEYQTKWQLADSQWDASAFFAVLIGLLIVEWLLRKRWGLV